MTLLFEHDVWASAQFEVAIAESEGVVLVGLAFLVDVSREGVRLGKENRLLQSPNLGADVQQFEDVVVRCRSVSLQAEHLEVTALFALSRYQHLQS